MKKVFSNEAAFELLNEHKKLLRKLQVIKDFIDRTGKELEIYYSSNNLAQHIVEIANTCLMEEVVDFHDDKIKQFVGLEYSHKTANEGRYSCQRILDEIQQPINELIKRLDAGIGNNYQWWMLRRKEKTAANDAYKALSELLEGKYVRSIHALEKWKDGLLVDHQAEALDDFEKNRRDYLQSFSSLVKPWEKGFELNTFNELKDESSQIEKDINACIPSFNEIEKETIKAAQELVKETITSKLKEIPIDELNSDHSGIRIKLLKQNGINSIYSAIERSQWDLESISGLGEDSAYEIKRKAEEFKKAIASTTYVSLNSDNKDRYSTEVVRYLCWILRNRPVLDSLNDEKSEILSEMHHCVDIPSKMNDARTFVFGTEKDRSVILGYKNRLCDSVTKARVIQKKAKSINEKKLISAKEAWEDFEHNTAVYFSILERLVPELMGNADSRYGLPGFLADEIQDEVFFPDGLLCSLRRYQEIGVKYILHQKKVLLGDEMGLGKTIQAIATMVSLKNIGAKHFMVVCPASVMTNWCKEIVKHSKLHYVQIYGYYRGLALQQWYHEGGVAVTTYETTSFISTDLEIGKIDLSLLIVDEAHYIKNYGAKRTLNVLSLAKRTNRLLFMTGTALENRVDEMVALISHLQPEIASKIADKTYLAVAQSFREEIAPVYYRRKREDVLSELPEKVEKEEWCDMTLEEESVYEDSLFDGFMAARRVSWNLDNLENSSKAKKLLELIDEAGDDGRKILVFSYFLDTISKIQELLGVKCLPPITGSTPPKTRQSIIDKFEETRPGTVLLAQIQSGGTGLNIQAASVVIICEPQIKPSIENQAISRAYRMGQARTVFVHRLLCSDSIDERIMEMLATKQKLFDEFADKSVAAQRDQSEISIDTKGQNEIVKEEIERLKTKHGRHGVN